VGIPAPYKHQLDAVTFFRNKKDGNLFLEMGTGKTRTAIMIRDEWGKNQALRTLVICPSVVTHNWRDEFLKFSETQSDEIHVMSSGTGKKKAEYITEKVLPYFKSRGIVILNYEALLSEDFFDAIYKWKPNCIIMDEVHYLKTATSKRSKLIGTLTKWADYRLGLTGTPILNNVNDIYGIFKAVDCGETFGTNAHIFAAKYLMDLNAAWKARTGYFPKWVNNPKTYPALNELVYKKSIRITKEECLDLPELVKVTRLIDWEPKQKKAYDDLKKEFLTFIDTKRSDGEKDSVTASLAMVKALRMLQVASGFVQTDLGEVHEFEKIPRLAVTKELLEELTPNHKVILWCSYKHNYKMLSRICDELKIKHVFITGEQDTNAKRESELSFRNDPDTRVVIANRAAGGVGINLVEASYSIVYSRNFSLAEELQSESRNHRGGSQIHSKITKIDLAIKDSIDEAVLEVLRNKKQVSTDVLDMVRK
jgi:SNF2 family DNA or RNA helicase